MRIDPRFLPISLSFAISSLRVTSLIIAHRFACRNHQSASVTTSVHFRFCHLSTSVPMYVRPPLSAPTLPITLSFAISSLRVTSLIIAHRFVCHDHQSASVSTSVHSQFLPSAHFHVHVCSAALVCAYIAHIFVFRHLISTCHIVDYCAYVRLP